MKYIFIKENAIGITLADKWCEISLAGFEELEVRRNITKKFVSKTVRDIWEALFQLFFPFSIVRVRPILESKFIRSPRSWTLGFFLAPPNPHSPLSHGGHIVPGDQKSFVLLR